jgi:dihydroorotate dehydrogenase (fumarate)
MSQLSTKYMGLNLNNPIIVGSSGLTNSIENLINIEQNGAGAVVLKSIFEEQIRYETEKAINGESEKIDHWKKAFNKMVEKNDHLYEEALNYMFDYAKTNSLDKYLKFISDAKKAIKIPVIASINCITPYDWQFFAKKMQDAGADALELNVFLLPSDLNKSSENTQNVYNEIISGVKKYVSIPVALKVGYYFSDLAYSLKNLSNSGIASLVLFNRPYNPDIDIKTLQISNSNILSSDNEYVKTLRWISILNGRVGCDLAASTGIHNSESVIKMLLSGANVVQLASIFYKHGFEMLPIILKGLSDWMDSHNFKSIDDFRGKLSMNKIENPAAYERVQFMKHYSKIE